MRNKTELEKIIRKGEIRVEIYTVRSTLAPQWWEFKKRFRWWRLEQRVRNARELLAPETQLALAWAEEALEREYLYGHGKEQ